MCSPEWRRGRGGGVEGGGDTARRLEGPGVPRAKAAGPAGAGRSLAYGPDRLTAAARRSADRFDDIALLLATRSGRARPGAAAPGLSGAGGHHG